MGGGPGVTIPGTYGFAWDKTAFATPETSIGTPDTGASYQNEEQLGYLVFLAWAQQHVGKADANIYPAMLGCIAGSALMRKAASVACADKNISTLTTDIIESLGRSLEEKCPFS